MRRRRALGLAVAATTASLLSACGRGGLAVSEVRAARQESARIARFGAIAPDDFTADGINRALRAVAAVGGEVVLAEGTYVIDKTVEIPTDNVTLRGAGPGTVLQATDNAFVMLYLHQRKLVTVADLRIVGYGQDGRGGAGINASQIERCTFENLTVERCGSSDAAGIFMQRSSYNRIAGCHLESNGRGLHLYRDSTNNVIDRCTGYRNAKEMIFITTGGSDNAVSNCVSENDAVSAPAVSIAIHRSDRTSVTDTIVRRTGTEQGIEIAAGADNVVAGCTISESVWAGLHVVNAVRTVVTGNRIVQNRQSGILLRKAGTPEDVRPCDDCIISGNEISGNNTARRPANEVSWAGIEIESGNNVIIESNVLDDNYSAAVYIHPGNSGTRIMTNELRGIHATRLINRGDGTLADING